MPYFLLLAAASAAFDLPVDLPALDAAIEKCEREAVLPVFAAEAERRSAFITAVFTEQAAISAERANIAARRRVLREAAIRPPQQRAAEPAESDQALALAQLALEDRQRILDDRRRLEALRQEAVDLKRQYFLTRCTTPRRRGD